MWQKRGLCCRTSKKASTLLQDLLGTGDMSFTSLRIPFCVLLKTPLRELLSISNFFGFELNDSYVYTRKRSYVVCMYRDGHLRLQVLPIQCGVSESINPSGNICSPSLRIACEIPPAQTFAHSVGSELAWLQDIIGDSDSSTHLAIELWCCRWHEL
ncbi:hypothetical protein BJV78DRAFT_1225901 [Lactifluus subvellereus]|nr:hypothetical protein BJV78DRAFT_1225901 [Lactifluus subvellereus]